tara:strand:- start:18 stop:509 length:492 start_codon:yes stop_codon:yes gene_type:complete
MSAIRHGTAPFPVGEVSTGAGNEKLLGLEIQGVDGKEYRLYKSSEVVASPATKCFQRSSAGGTSVEMTDDDTTSYCCGVAVADQVALAVGDYFWLQVAGEVSLTGKSGHGIDAGEFLQPSGGGAEEGLVKTVGAGAVEAQLPIRATAVATNAITALIYYKLWG